MQRLLFGFPEGSVRISSALSVLRKGGCVTYFVGEDNYFSHAEDDEDGYRYIIATLMENRHVRACELSRAPMNIPHRTLMNWAGILRKEGSSGLFRPRVAHSHPKVMTAEVALACGRLLDQGYCPAEVSVEVGIQADTLRKAIKRGAIPRSGAEFRPSAPAQASEGKEVVGTTKSERSVQDAEDAKGLGTACRRADERIAAAQGLVTQAMTRFEHSQDVFMGGLLVGLPVLVANGIFHDVKKLGIDKIQGFYHASHILLTLGFMALGRIRRPEGLRGVPPGEFGKLIGLDRCPEVKTMREKIHILAHEGDPQAWMKSLSSFWMKEDPQEAAFLYVDGHVRVYHGETAHLPKRYVSRQKLCLSGTTDYWVNDAIGRPFLVVSQALNEGLAKALLEKLVPDLLISVPEQPTQEELDADPLLHRFVTIFDREGATHSLLSDLWEKRIGAITYRKNVKDKWPESEFSEHEVSGPEGDLCKMLLAARETSISSGKDILPVVEVRRLTESRHQTSIISTARKLDILSVAGRMFARWCQENYFSYMMQHYDIDGLVEYGSEGLPGTVEVANPRWREAEKKVSLCLGVLRKLQGKLMGKLLGKRKEQGKGKSEEKEDWNSPKEVQKRAEHLEVLESAQKDLEDAKSVRHLTPRKVRLDTLSEEERTTQLKPLSKALCDTVKMISYRAETALVALIKPHLKNGDEARALIRELLVSSANISPDEIANTLTVSIHRMGSPYRDTACECLLNKLNKEQFLHPETQARMIFRLV